MLQTIHNFGLLITVTLLKPTYSLFIAIAILIINAGIAITGMTVSLQPIINVTYFILIGIVLWWAYNFVTKMQGFTEDMSKIIQEVYNKMHDIDFKFAAKIVHLESEIVMHKEASINFKEHHSDLKKINEKLELALSNCKVNTDLVKELLNKHDKA